MNFLKKAVSGITNGIQLNTLKSERSRLDRENADIREKIASITEKEALKAKLQECLAVLEDSLRMVTNLKVLKQIEGEYEDPAVTKDSINSRYCISCKMKCDDVPDKFSPNELTDQHRIVPRDAAPSMELALKKSSHFLSKGNDNLKTVVNDLHQLLAISRETMEIQIAQNDKRINEINEKLTELREAGVAHIF